MKTILVDAVGVFVIPEEGINEEMHQMLEEFPNNKIILTGANDEQMEKFGLNKMPYKVFTLKHNPEKTEQSYFRKMLKKFNLDLKEVVYFEHNPEAVKSAQSVGIKTYFYDKDKKDLKSLKQFLETNL